MLRTRVGALRLDQGAGVRAKLLRVSVWRCEVNTKQRAGVALLDVRACHAPRGTKAKRQGIEATRRRSDALPVLRFAQRDFRGERERSSLCMRKRGDKIKKLRFSSPGIRSREAMQASLCHPPLARDGEARPPRRPSERTAETAELRGTAAGLCRRCGWPEAAHPLSGWLCSCLAALSSSRRRAGLMRRGCAVLRRAHARRDSASDALEQAETRAATAGAATTQSVASSASFQRGEQLQHISSGHPRAARLPKGCGWMSRRRPARPALARRVSQCGRRRCAAPIRARRECAVIQPGCLE
jgi:hypothetical protein